MARRKQLLGEWDRLSEAKGSEILQAFDEDAFLAAFSVVLSNTFYVPSAARFALLPPLTGIQRTGDERSCTLDYDPETDRITLTAQRDYRSLRFTPDDATDILRLSPGEYVRVFDGRPNLELLLATGTVERDNPSDCVALEFELVPTDRLYSAKRQILEAMGFRPSETFLIYKERIPTQLLSFLRLSRIQDPSQLTQARSYPLVCYRRRVP